MIKSINLVFIIHHVKLQLRNKSSKDRIEKKLNEYLKKKKN